MISGITLPFWPCQDAEPPIVVDLGSSWVRAGYAGDDAPRTVFSNLSTPNLVLVGITFRCL